MTSPRTDHDGGERVPSPAAVRCGQVIAMLLVGFVLLVAAGLLWRVGWQVLRWAWGI